MNGISRGVTGSVFSKKAMAFFPVISVSIFAFLVVFYLRQAHIPSDLHAFSGVFSIQKLGRNSYVSIDGGEQGKMRFTCADMFAGFSECVPRRKIPDLLGQDATVYWYAHRYFPMVVEQKLVILEVGGKEIVSREMSQTRLGGSKAFGVWLYGGGVLFSAGLTILFYWLACRQRSR